MMIKAGIVERTDVAIATERRDKVVSNTSTIVKQVVGGDEKGTQFLGDKNTGSWPSMLEESRI
jgi:hypothetical protein